MSETAPAPGFLHKLLFLLFYPIAKPLSDMQARLARIEQRLEPLETWFNNLNQWAYEEGERSKRIIEQADLLRQIRSELGSSAQIVTESSVYFERAVREMLDQRAQPDAVPAGKADRPAGR
jgi:hypothetical protein